MRFRPRSLFALVLIVDLPAHAVAQSPLASEAVATSQVQASTQGPSSPEDIIVQATRQSRRQISQAAQAITPPGNLDREPAAQFQEPVCPGVVGMPPAFQAAMVARIKYVAARANVRVARPGPCKANLLVMFVANGQSAMRSLWRNGPWLFGDLDRTALQDLAEDPGLGRLAAEPGPVHAWTNIETRGRNGEGLAGGDDTSIPSTLQTSGGNSHITMEVRKDIVGAVIVIDVAAANDLSVTEIADYCAMRGLAQTRPPAKSGAISTILSLFDEGANPPVELTKFDLAYLRAIYGSAPYVAGISKLAHVARELRKAAIDD